MALKVPTLGILETCYDDEIYRLVKKPTLLLPQSTSFGALGLLERKQKKLDKKYIEHNIIIFALLVVMLGCVGLGVSLTHTSIAGYHFSFEIPICFLAGKLLLLVNVTCFTKPKRAKIIVTLAFLMKIIGSIALLSVALNGKKLQININNNGIKAMLIIGMAGIALMVGHVLADAEKKNIISLSSKCLPDFCCK